MNRLAVLAVLCGLGGCGAQNNVGSDETIGYRNPTAIIGGTSRFDAGKFAGDWVTVSCLGPCAARESYGAATDDVYLRTVGGKTEDYVITAPGVLRRQGSTDRLVVMWVDTGFRTAVIGDADGRWAAILDRSTKPGPDRIAAAIEILDFNGWDTTRLKKVSR
jgi:apolipoprotein D and lipocalin family protein